MSDSTPSATSNTPSEGSLRLESASGQYVLIPQTVSGQAEGEGNESIDIGNLLAMLQRRKRLAVAVFSTIFALGTALTLVQRIFSPVYEGEFSLLVSDPINLAERGQDSTSALRDAALQSSNIRITQDLIDLLKSPLLLKPISSRLGISEKDLEKGLEIKSRSGDSGVMDVTLAWDNPLEGQRILAYLGEAFLAYSLKERQEKLAKGVSFLNEQAPYLQQRVADLQQQLSSFRSQNSFLEPKAQAEAIQLQRQELKSSRYQLLRKKAELEALKADVRAGNLSAQQFQSVGGGQVAGAPQATNAVDPVSRSAFTQLQMDLTLLEKQLADAEATYQSTSPLLQSLRARINRLRPLLQQRQLEAVQASLSQVEGELAEIQRQELQLSKQFAANPILIKQYEGLQQRLDVARDNLTSYLKAREEFRLEVAQRTVPWRLITNPSFATRPVKPNLGRNLLISMLLGAAAGVGAALLRDKMDHVFHRAREVEQALSLPLLGSVPYLPLGEQITLADGVAALENELHFELKESLRNLYTSVRLLRADNSLRLIALTSTVQGEGKSFVIALFAQTLAELGQRVLVVDADLRRPQQHHYLGAANANGFANLLTDVYSSPERLIQPISDTLDLLSAGPAPPDAPRLLSSQRCSNVVQQLRELPGYDVILFDTCPLLYLSDPLLLSEHLDGILFLVSLGCVDRDLAAQALQRLKASSVDVLGVVTNGLVKSSATSDGYGYKYTKNYIVNESGIESEETIKPSAGKEPLAGRQYGPRKLLAWLDERG